MSERVKRSLWITLIILMQSLVVVLWGIRKERFNIDEVFSYEGAKSGGYGMRYWDRDIDSFYGKNYTKEDFEKHITIEQDDLLIAKPIEVVDALAHRNVYYTILNLAATFTAGTLTKWTGIGLNLLLFILTQIVLYRLVARICNSFRCAVIAILIYGFSAGGISTVLYMRCYMLLILMLLVAFSFYLKSMENAGWRAKLLYLIPALLSGVCCIKIHQFGMLFFAIMTGGVIFYVLLCERNKDLLFGLMGAAIIGLIICVSYLKQSTGLLEIFGNSLNNLNIEGLIDRGKQIIAIVSRHLWYHPLGSILMGVPIVCSVIKKRKRTEEEKKQRKLGIIVGLCVCGYLCVLMLGSAIAWKYFSIIYPFIYLCWIMLSDIQWLSQRMLAIMVTFFLCIVGVSYYNKNISELFIGELETERFFEENYTGVNGVMIHADGAGENWLYEAAYLWPRKSEINVQLLSAVKNASRLMIPQDQEEEILLWMTIDYDNEEVMKLFIEKTSFTKWESIYTTDSLRVYLCGK